MPRYEFVEGNSQKFWEISLEGSSFTTRWGRLGTDGQSKTLDFADEQTAQKEYAKIIRSKTSKGYQLVDGEESEDDEGGEGEGGTGASNSSMEEAILLNPDDPAPWLVYGDFLQSQGDLRGELTALFAKDPAAAAAFVESNSEALYGELADAVTEGNELRELKWKYGFIQSASLRREYDSNTDLAQLTAQFLALPVTRFIRSLTFGLASNESDNDWTETITAVADARGDVIEHLYFNDYTYEDCEISWTAFGDFSKVWPRLKKLRTLHIRAGEGGELGKLDLPELRTFIRESGGLAAAEVNAIDNARWPKLEHLEIWFGQEAYNAGGDLEQIPNILEGKGLGQLKHLGLKNGEFADELVPALAKSKILPQLQSLDLSKSTMGEAGAQALIANAAKFKHLEKLDLSENFLGDSHTGAIEAALPNTRVETSEQREDEGDGPEGRYAALGE